MNNLQIAENWINKKPNRKQGQRVAWTYGKMYCDDADTIWSYGRHYPIAYRTNTFFRKRPVFMFNTMSGYDWGKTSSTNKHQWYVRKAIEKVNGLIIEINHGNAGDVLLRGVDGDYNFLDLNREGEALIDASPNVVLITESAMIHLDFCKTIAEAKKSLIPKGLGNDFFKWKNYFFKPTGLDNKSFAIERELTLKSIRAWTRQGIVNKPKNVKAWYQIKARIFGNNPLSLAFGINENPAPYISGTVYIGEDIHRYYGKKILDTKGMWWKVFPMKCKSYTDKWC